ncbi:42813_t:CDS:2, partial [Gigaspora margarita]
QLIHLNEDKEKQEKKFLPEPMKFLEPKNNPPEQYKSKAWNIVKLEKEKENYIDSYKINIAINSETASGKTSVGKLIAEKHHYQFINTGVFYHYLGFKFQSDNFKTNFYKIINYLDNLKNENHLDEINTIVENFSKEEYFFSEKGFVVVGRDVTFNILPKAEVKILLSTDLNIRTLRRAQQLDSDNIINNILLNIINHDSKSFTLFTEAK